MTSVPATTNRVVMVLNEHGEPTLFCSDQPIELYWVDPNTPGDAPVYLYGSVQVGSQFVDQVIGGHPIGHYDDAELGKLPAGLPPGRALEMISQKL